MARYLINILIGIDQLLTTLIGGWPDETLSSYAYRMEMKGRLGGRIFRPLIDFFFGWQDTEEGHCHKAFTDEKLRRQQPPELR